MIFSHHYYLAYLINHIFFKKLLFDQKIMINIQLISQKIYIGARNVLKRDNFLNIDIN
jgi:hypothetical protein